MQNKAKAQKISLIRAYSPVYPAAGLSPGFLYEKSQRWPSPPFPESNAKLFPLERLCAPNPAPKCPSVPVPKLIA